jgi:serine O-acetyltransferase
MLYGGAMSAADLDSVNAAPPRRRVSADEADWTRERPRGFWDPGRKLIKTLRDYSRLEDRNDPVSAFRRSLIVTRHRFWSAVTSCDVPLGFNPGGGFMLPHPTGVVIHPKSVVGPNCRIMQQVTLGAVGRSRKDDDASGEADATAGERKGAPVLGGHVDVGAGAKIIGAVTIGDHAVIGANAVLLIDVPDGATAAGVPARLIASGARPAP